MISALLITLVSYILKFTTYRQFGPIDVIVGFSEIPAVVTATCSSLLIASLYLPVTEQRVISGYICFSVIILIINLIIFRFVESRKLRLGSHLQKVSVGLSVVLSYAMTYFVSLSLAYKVYASVPK